MADTPDRADIKRRLRELIARSRGQLESSVQAAIESDDIGRLDVPIQDIKTSIGYLAQLGFRADAQRLAKENQSLFKRWTDETFSEAFSGPRWADARAAMGVPTRASLWQRGKPKDRRAAIHGYAQSVARFLGELETSAGLESESSPADERAEVNPKRSTQKGEAQAKLIAALTLHHKYSDGSCLNTEPIGVKRLGRLAKVSPDSASRFFAHNFKGHDKYKAACQNTQMLIGSLKLLRGEITPSTLLYGRNPPGEGPAAEE